MIAKQVNFAIVTQELTVLAGNLEKDLMETRHKLFKDAMVLDWGEIDEAYQVDMESEFSDVEDIFEVLRPKTPEYVEMVVSVNPSKKKIQTPALTMSSLQKIESQSDNDDSGILDNGPLDPEAAMIRMNIKKMEVEMNS
jgi:hypothetical protein